MNLRCNQISKNKERYILVTQTLFFLLLAILMVRVLGFQYEVTSLYSVGSSFIFAIIISLIPLLSQTKYKCTILIDIFINISFILITSVFLFYEKQEIFKILYLMPVVVSSLKYRKTISYIYVGLIFFILLTMGYLNNFTFIDADIMFIGVLFLLAWLLGNLTEAEAKVREELERIATHDSLTDLLNHRSFQDILDEKITEAKESKSSLSLVLLDIDFFKVYNDSLGHQKGDHVLKSVGNILKSCTGTKGYCARYGGEEFVIILPKSNIREAMLLAEQIRIEIEKSDFPGVEVLPKGKLTMSMGIAGYPIMADSKEKLIQKADEALYKAKFVSKNKVEVYYSVFDELGLVLKDGEQEILNSIRTLTMVINAKDRYTYGHSERTMELSKKISQILKLDDQLAKSVTYGALLHDIGKIEISREVLNKPKKLNQSEWEIFKQHPQWGTDIIRPIKSLQGSLDIILYHHENYDGTGYPQGLQGEEIPIGARILRIIDSYDAITTYRPYKEAMSKEQAIEELSRFSGTYYDPQILQVFCQMLAMEED